ncbi:MAG: hypothetical protein ACXABY_23960 [Candidatus Thorarchaeota archaeon]|jgi:hypothetical protein
MSVTCTVNLYGADNAVYTMNDWASVNKKMVAGTFNFPASSTSTGMEFSLPQLGVIEGVFFANVSGYVLVYDSTNLSVKAFQSAATASAMGIVPSSSAGALTFTVPFLAWGY